MLTKITICHRLKAASCLLLLLGGMGTNTVNAAPLGNTPPLIPIDANNAFFYEIGGGTNYRVSVGIEEPKQLALFKDFALILSAENEFSPFASIKQTMNNLADEVKSKLLNIANAYAQALAGLPGYALCRANPLVCQQFENFTIRAEEKARKTTAFINNVEKEIGDARGNLEGWFKAGKSGRLITAIKEAKAAGEDLEAVADKVREYSGKEGLKWIGATLAGGDGQPPIRPVADTVRAGFNMLLGRTVSSGSAYTGTDPLGDYWDTPEEAAKWLVDVVGEFRPDINNDRAQKKITGDLSGKDDGDAGKGGEDVTVNSEFVSQDVTTPGLGLSPKIAKETGFVFSTIASLLKTQTPSVKEMTEIVGKSSNMVITPRLLGIIRNSPMQRVLVKRISEEASQTNVLRYALAARRMLIAGKNEPHIASYDVATKEIERRLAVLDANIESVLFERKISKELLSDTFGKLLAYTQDNIDKTSTYSPKPWQPTFKDGGVKQ